MSDVTWVPVPGASGYEVSSEGHIRSLDRWVGLSRRRFATGQLLNPIVDPKWGYLRVAVRLDSGHKIQRGVHQLVCAAFHGPQPSPEHMVRHLNGVPSDNRPENLTWGTGTENQYDRINHGRNALANKTHCKWGHPFDAANTRLRGNGTARNCRACDSRRQMEYQARKRESA